MWGRLDRFAQGDDQFERKRIGGRTVEAYFADGAMVEEQEHG